MQIMFYLQIYKCFSVHNAFMCGAAQMQKSQIKLAE